MPFSFRWHFRKYISLVTVYMWRIMEKRSNINYINTALYWPILIAIKCTLGKASVLYSLRRIIHLLRVCYIVSISICVCACMCMYVYVQLQSLVNNSLPRSLALSIVYSTSTQFLLLSPARVDLKWHSRERNDSCQIFNGT